MEQTDQSFLINILGVKTRRIDFSIRFLAFVIPSQTFSVPT